MSQFIGPALPPHLKSSNGDAEDDDVKRSDVACVRRRSSSASSKTDAEDVLILMTDPSDEMFQEEIEDESHGPSLPVGLKKTNVIGGGRDSVKSLDEGRGKEGLSGREHRRSRKSTVSSASKVETNSRREQFLGPQLPSNLIRRLSSDVEEEASSSSELRKIPFSDRTVEDESQDNEKVYIGPALPSKLRNQSMEEESQDYFGPTLPPNSKSTVRSGNSSSDSVRCVEPQLPSQKRQESSSDDEVGNHSSRHFQPTKSREDSSVVGDDEKDSQTFLGPALPPGFRTKTSEEESLEYIGPVLPPGFRSTTQERSKNPGRMQGPALPPGFVAGGGDENSDSDSEAVGPQLVPDASNQTQRQLEMRARMLRHEMATSRDAVDPEYKRESWMLELPPEKAANLGMGPRQFRMKERLDPGDRSVWTDTPADRLKKKLNPKSEEIDKSELNIQAVIERDEAMDKMAEKHSSKRGSQSLLEMHQEKLKKKKKKDEKEGKTQERRPFSRELDLQTNRFDEAQKKSIFNKARLLNDRFSAGQSKYL